MKLEEGRKRYTTTNALLALSFSTSAAQSPKNFIRKGNIEAPGVQLMSRMKSVRKKATASGLDNPRISPKIRTFKEFLELCESSSGESGRRLLPSRGPEQSRSERRKQQQDKSNRAALSKAGFSRSSRPITGTGARGIKWTETSASTNHGTETATYKNQSDYATSQIGNTGPKRNIPTIQRALKAKQILKQFGGDRTPRPVHDVAVNKNRHDDGSSTMTKGRSFKQEVTKGVPSNLEKAGAKVGDIKTSTPTSDSRSKMYRKYDATGETNKRTGITADRVTRSNGR